MSILFQIDVLSSFSVLSPSNNDVKMQDLERFEHQVEDMYNILLNISSELLTIKSMMKANRRIAENNDSNKTEGKGVF